MGAGPEPAAHVQLQDPEAQFLTQALHGLDNPRDGPDVRRRVEDLGPDVEVQAAQRDRITLQRKTHGPRQEISIQGQAELAALVPRRDVGVRMGNDSRGDAEQDLRPPPLAGREVRKHLELHEAVDDNAPNPRVKGGVQLGLALRTAVHLDAGGREPRRERRMELSKGDDVQPQSLILHDSGHRPGQKRLAGVAGRGVRPAFQKIPPHLRAAGTDHGFVQNIKRRPKPRGQLHAVRPSPEKMRHGSPSSFKKPGIGLALQLVRPSRGISVRTGARSSSGIWNSPKLSVTLTRMERSD